MKPLLAQFQSDRRKERENKVKLARQAELIKKAEYEHEKIRSYAYAKMMTNPLNPFGRLNSFGRIDS